MAIWSFTQERLDRLKKQIEDKKAEHDLLEGKSEKDLWVADLDDFLAEWENQLKLDAEIQTTIRRMNRRVSKKIGAGGRGRKVRDDDDYQEKKPAARAPKAAKAAKVVPMKASDRFQELFGGASKSKAAASATTDGAMDLSDDDFDALIKPKAKMESEPPVAAKVEISDDEGVVPIQRTKRAAAAKPKSWAMDLDSDSDDDGMLGDVAGMVKGINGSTGAEPDRNRLSLFAMSRPETSGGENGSVLPKQLKTKPSRIFDDNAADETNYEALALSSPRKSTKPEDVDALLASDDDLDLPPVTAKPAVVASRPAPAKASATATATVKKGRGRPAGAKNKPKDEKPAAKPTHLSPAAKAYAAKKSALAKRSVLSDEEDEDDVMEEAPAPKPAARGRPARSAATTKKKPVYIDSEDDIEVDGESDDFAMDDSE
jgi:DNA topoisomerase II